MGSRLYFFNSGTKIAHLKSLGKIPDMREEFIILDIRGSSSLLFSFSNQVGIGSNWLFGWSRDNLHKHYPAALEDTDSTADKWGINMANFRMEISL